MNCAVLDHYAARSGNFLATFRDNRSIPSSGRTGTISCPETLPRIYHCALRNGPEQRNSRIFMALSVGGQYIPLPLVCQGKSLLRMAALCYILLAWISLADKSAPRTAYCSYEWANLDSYKRSGGPVDSTVYIYFLFYYCCPCISVYLSQ